MSTLTFLDIFNRLIGHEGGYVNDPRDPGGETNWGITKRTAQANGYVADDGIIGNMTIAAIKKMAISDVIMRLNAERLEFYCKLGTFATFGKGWVRRVAGNLKYGAIDNEV